MGSRQGERVREKERGIRKKWELSVSFFMSYLVNVWQFPEANILCALDSRCRPCAGWVETAGGDRSCLRDQRETDASANQCHLKERRIRPIYNQICACYVILLEQIFWSSIFRNNGEFHNWICFKGMQLFFESNFFLKANLLWLTLSWA